MEILKLYSIKKEDIEKRITDFKNLPKERYFEEFLFCTLTPQSNAKKCWEAVQEIIKTDLKNQKKISKILKAKTRFHNNKSKYILKNNTLWPYLKEKIEKSETEEIRNWIANNIHGYGLKEASHFLRNIGKSNNKIAILDRHILRNLKELKVIKEDNIKNKKDYLEKEEQFINYSKSIGIPIDHLDLLFWSKENGEIFK